MKRSEADVLNVIIRRQMYDMQYVPQREKSANFINGFKEIITNYENTT